MLLPYYNLPNPTLKEERGTEAFGSTDLIAWIQTIKKERPLRPIKVQVKEILGLIDSGADVSCIAGKDWPSPWPIKYTFSSLTGLGLTNNVARSTKILSWDDGEDKGKFQPYVLSIKRRTRRDGPCLCENQTFKGYADS